MAQHIISVSQEVNPYCDCCSLNQHVKLPEYTQWLLKNGVRKTDYEKLVEPWVSDANRIADRCVPYTILSIVSCGLSGWCCQLWEFSEMNKRGRHSVEKFNVIYKPIKIRVDVTRAGLVFTKLG
tara:strand:- start:3067 stop:3438 length:372 start_codon:yes stop_codon:yes gene_type:complete